MLNRTILLALLFCLSFKPAAAVSSFITDSLSAIVKSADKIHTGKNTADFLKRYFENASSQNVLQGKNEITAWLSQSHLENKSALIYFTEGIYQKYIHHLSNAQNCMLKAIESVSSTEDHYLLYIFFKNLAFIQTDEGNAIGAISSYRLAKREAVGLNDELWQTLINIDIADVYYKYDFFFQALSSLDDAEKIRSKYLPGDEHTEAVVFSYKCLIFFRMKKPDSVVKYDRLMKAQKNRELENYSQLKRNAYFLCVLNGDLKRAITLINVALKDSLYKSYGGDRENLADIFFRTKQTDSAVYVINELLADTLEANHPEIKFHLYDMLAQIARGKNDDKLASFYFNKALQQSEENINRLIQVGNILSQIKIDDIEGVYNQKNEAYKKERLWLVFAVVVALLITAIVVMFYRNARQKRHYERLLFTAQKQELAFINSHEVRRHLSNILGIIDVLQHSDDKEMEYKEMEDSLFYSAEHLDKAIKSFSEKLKD